MRTSSSIDPRNKKEYYLEPFRRAVEAGAEAVAYGLKAGVDCFTDDGKAVEAAAREALERGLITWEDVDRSIRNSFRTRIRLGLYDRQGDNPYREIPEERLNSPEHTALARKAVRESAVFLKNEAAGSVPAADPGAEKKKRFLPLEPEGKEKTLRISLTVKNTGTTVSDEVVQIYVRQNASRAPRPRKQLKAFERAGSLPPEEERRVEFCIPLKELEYYDVVTERMVLEEGSYTILAGASSEDIRLEQTLSIGGVKIPPRNAESVTKADHYDDCKGAVLYQGHDSKCAVYAKTETAELLYRDFVFEKTPRKIHVLFQGEGSGTVELYAAEQGLCTGEPETAAESENICGAVLKKNLLLRQNCDNSGKPVWKEYLLNEDAVENLPTGKKMERLGIPPLTMSDGPMGVRNDFENDTWKVIGNTDDYVTYLPSNSAIASSWNRETAGSCGSVLGAEARGRGKDVILAPGINIKRSPLCGRNFEYMSEDPYLTGELAVPMIQGIQEQDTAACVKHFALNNQETERLWVDVEVDDRALYEIYLPAFEKAVKEGDSWSLMGAYNTFEHQKAVLDAARESVILLKNEEQILPLDRKKTEKILVVGDNANRIHSNGGGSAEIKALYEITPLLGIKKFLGGNVQVDYVQGYDPDDLEEKTSEINWQADSLKPSENECKTEHCETSENEKQEDYRNPSENGNAVNSNQEDDSLKQKQQVRLRQEALRREAVEKAADYDTVLLIGGQNHNQDLEGMDREDMKLPYGQDELIFELLRVNPNVIVVMISGSPVEMPWADQVKALIWQYYSGMEGGTALAEALFGEINPSGRLAETFPVRSGDCSAHSIGEFPGGKKVRYEEGIFVGYRHYNTRGIPVLFPFGHGLSYTEFSIHDLHAETETADGTCNVRLTLSVTNTGSRAGKETVQIYVGKKDSSVERPARELRAFEKVQLEPGETRKLEFLLDESAFSCYDQEKKAFAAEPGMYQIYAGKSVEDICGQITVCFEKGE